VEGNSVKLILDDLIERGSRFSSLMGLGKPEIKIYVFLLLNGKMNAREISSRINMSYNKVYSYLKKLEYVNWIRRVDSRPTIYEARPLKEIWGITKALIENKLSQMEKEIIEPLSSLFERSPTPLAVSILTNKDSVISEIIKMLSEQSNSYKIAISIPDILTKEVISSIIAAGSRAKVRILMESNIEIAKELTGVQGITVKLASSLFGSGVIARSILLVVKSGQTITGIKSSHNYFVDLGNVYFDYLWSNSQ
jgi:sugar-specific transcriptional regulator TrmB